MSELSCDTPFIGRNDTDDLSLYPLVRKGCSKANTTCVALPGISDSAGVIFALSK